jgi:hypothetical protein
MASADHRTAVQSIDADDWMTGSRAALAIGQEKRQRSHGFAHQRRNRYRNAVESVPTEPNWDQLTYLAIQVSVIAPSHEGAVGRGGGIRTCECRHQRPGAVFQVHRKARYSMGLGYGICSIAVKGNLDTDDRCHGWRAELRRIGMAALDPRRPSISTLTPE